MPPPRLAPAYVTFNSRVRAMRRFGQVPTGIIEDAIALGAALWLTRIEPTSSNVGRKP